MTNEFYVRIEKQHLVLVLGIVGIAATLSIAAMLAFPVQTALSDHTPDDVDCNTIPCVHSADIVNGQVRTADLAKGAVTSEKIRSGAVMSDDIQDGGVGLVDLATGSVDSSKVAPDSLTAADLATGSVGTFEIFDGSVGSIDVIDNSLTASDLATGSVGSFEIIDGAVTVTDVNFVKRVQLFDCGTAPGCFFNPPASAFTIQDENVDTVSVIVVTINNSADSVTCGVYDIVESSFATDTFLVKCAEGDGSDGEIMNYAIFFPD